MAKNEPGASPGRHRRGHQTGGRLKRVLPYVQDEPFCLTYGDGLADVDITAVIAHHRRAGPAGHRDRRAAARPLRRARSRRRPDHRLQGEAGGEGGLINGGFFVLSPEVGNLIAGDDTIWEHEPLETSRRHGPARRSSASRLLAADGYAARQESAGGAVGVRLAAVEGLDMIERAFWRNRRVLLTGHTGFKGAWLACGSSGWAPRSSASRCRRTPSRRLFSLLPPMHGLHSRLARHPRPGGGGGGGGRGAARDRHPPGRPVAGAPLVPRPGRHLRHQRHGHGPSARQPARRRTGSKAVLVVTTDKVYATAAIGHAFAEDDPLGGNDPYSASKAAAELVVAA